MLRQSRREAWRGHPPVRIAASSLSRLPSIPVPGGRETERTSLGTLALIDEARVRMSAACDDGPSPTRTSSPRHDFEGQQRVHSCPTPPPRDQEYPHGPCPVLRALACVVLGAPHADAKASKIIIDLASATATLLAARARSRPGAQADIRHTRWRRRRRYRRRQRRVRELDGKVIAVVVDIAL